MAIIPSYRNQSTNLRYRLDLQISVCKSSVFCIIEIFAKKSALTFFFTSVLFCPTWRHHKTFGKKVKWSVLLATVLSIRTVAGAGALKKALVNGSRCAISAETLFFENCAHRALLWCNFWTAVKIASNLGIFTLHQTRWYIHCFVVRLCIWLYDLKIQIIIHKSISSGIKFHRNLTLWHDKSIRKH